MTVLLFLLIRRPDEADPRRAMIHALEQLQDAIYGELDKNEGEQLAENLQIALQAERVEINKMAGILSAYVEQGNVPFVDYNPSLSRRTWLKIEGWGKRIGQKWHKYLVLAGLLITALGAIITFGTLVWIAISPAATTQAFLAGLAVEAQASGINSQAGEYIRLVVDLATGVVAMAGFYFIVRGNEKRGLILAVVSVVLSLTAVQLITFYLDQFTAILPTLYQFVFLLVILSYRSWYMNPDAVG